MARKEWLWFVDISRQKWSEMEELNQWKKQPEGDNSPFPPNKADYKDNKKADACWDP